MTLAPEFELDELAHDEHIHSLDKLTRDLRAAAGSMTTGQARYLVDMYYEMQEYRKRAMNQRRSLLESEEPNDALLWLFDQFSGLEKAIRNMLGRYADEQVVGRWAQSIAGIGPVITAGLLAHIDIEKAPTAGHIWRFAGLDPTQEWSKGEKRPWNARLKVLCWKIGESFVKVMNRDNDIYGHVYAQRKALETANNEAGLYAEQAKAKLERFKIGKDTEAYAWYAKGLLPPGHLHARAKRYAVKLFLSHYQHVAFETRFGTPPPKPYILNQEGHVHFIAPPNWPL